MERVDGEGNKIVFVGIVITGHGTGEDLVWLGVVTPNADVERLVAIKNAKLCALGHRHTVLWF